MSVEVLTFTYPATRRIAGRAHVGVVGSGDLEVLLEPTQDPHATVIVATSVAGYGTTWKAVLDRFFAAYDGLVRIDINDAGATPGTVALRLWQAVELSEGDRA
jgi:malonate decarboxylase delta subunit